MKVVYPICCGVDVHKTFLIAPLITYTGIVPHYSKKRFSTFNNSILQFKQWLIDNNCFDICMESTGKYWVPVYNLLEDTIHITVANPKWVKAVSSEKNRFQNAFSVCTVDLDAVVSDMFGKSASSIMDYLVSSDSFDPVHCSSLLHKSLKKKADTVIESIEGYQMTQEQKERIGMVRSHLEFVQQSIANLDEKLDKMVAPYERAITLLCTIPVVDRKSAITIISEIGTDMSQFANPKRLCCWAGLAPSNNESAGKKKSVRITRAGVYLKPALVQVAHAAVKSDKAPYYKIKYERLYKRRGKKRAIIAIARMILTAIYNMFVTSKMWNPNDLYKIDMASRNPGKTEGESN